MTSFAPAQITDNGKSVVNTSLSSEIRYAIVGVLTGEEADAEESGVSIHAAFPATVDSL